MPKVDGVVAATDKPQRPDVPEKLRPYTFHGVELDWHGKEDAIGDCPFCGRERKFRVNVKTGLFRCLVCSEGSAKGGGNSYSFLRSLHSTSEQVDSTGVLEQVAKERGYLSADVLRAFECSASAINDRLMIPGYGADKKLNQLYVRRMVDGKYRPLPTPTHNHHIFGLNLHQNKPNVVICEGPWDAMALYEVFSYTKLTGEASEETSNPAESLLSEWDIIATPGCNVFNPSWIPLFAGKNVFILFHNDHPRVNEKTKQPIPSAGLAGAKRVTAMLMSGKKKPAGISYMKWGSESYHDESKPSGFDVRDYFNQYDTREERAGALHALLSRFTPSEEKWLEDGLSQASEAPKIELIECTDYTELIMAWQNAMVWHEGLECALGMMLATCLSTMQVGDPLWIKVYGPPGCGKSTLCEAVSSATQFVLAKSTFRGFMSGYKGEGEGEDYSLISRLNGMTFVTKDGDTLLQLPNLGQILSEGRDIYDGVTRSDFKNGTGKDYLGLRMTWILCGTASLRELDDSELGARFVDVVILDGIDNENEDAVLLQVAERAERNLATTVGADIESHHDTAMLTAMQKTGGYVCHLRTHASEILTKVHMTPNQRVMCAKYGKFVAFMRARPSTRQDESAEREFAARLTSQMVRITKCLAGVMGKSTVDDDVIKWTRKVAMDTARGIVYNLARELYAEPLGMEVKALALRLNRGVEEVRKLLRFLRDIEAVDFVTGTSNHGVKGQPKWKLSQVVRSLWEFAHKPQF